jgi:hypothetical protein
MLDTRYWITLDTMIAAGKPLPQKKTPTPASIKARVQGARIPRREAYFPYAAAIAE